jgi:hypothetical protein
MTKEMMAVWGLDKMTDALTMASLGRVVVFLLPVHHPMIFPTIVTWLRWTRKMPNKVVYRNLIQQELVER